MPSNLNETPTGWTETRRLNVKTPPIIWFIVELGKTR